jgi:hypothetical protein
MLATVQIAVNRGNPVPSHGAEAATDSYTEQVLAACNDFDRSAMWRRQTGMRG